MNTCMGCHKIVHADAEPIKKLTEMYQKNTPLKWTKVHDLPDYVRFSHKPHVLAKNAEGQPLLQCQTCHGPVETMEHQRQVPDLSMGWCVNCHRTATRNGVAGKPVHASIDCSTCHY